MLLINFQMTLIFINIFIGNYMEERIDLLDNHFNKSSWFNSINVGWEGKEKNFF